MTEMRVEPSAALEFVRADSVLRVHGPGADMHESGCAFEVSDDGVSFGSSEAVLSVVRRLWSDGSAVSQDGADNAESSFFLRIKGSLHDLPRGEAAFRQVFPGDGEVAEMIWRPAVDVPAAVRVVLHMKMDLQFDGLAEAGLLGRRVLQVTVAHAPFVRSEFETVVEGFPIFDGDLVSVAPLADPAWDTNPPGDIWDGYPLYKEAPIGKSLVWTGSHNIDGNRWLGLRGEAATVVATISGRTYTLHPAVSDGGSIFNWEMPSTGTITRLEFLPIPGVKLNVGEFGVWTREFPTITTYLRPRQGHRVIKVGGTERTEGVLHVDSRNGTTGLGTVLVHTSSVECPGFNPDLMTGLLTHGTTGTNGPEGAPPAGQWSRVDVTGAVSHRQVSQLCPGSYAVVAWLRSKATQALTLTGRSAVILPDAGQDPAASEFSTPVAFTANVPQLVPLGIVEWPAVDAASGQAAMVLDTMLSASDEVHIGGWWAFPIGKSSSLTAVSTDRPHLWVRSESPVHSPRVRVNTVNDEETGYTPGSRKVIIDPDLVFPAGECLTYVVATGVDIPLVEYRYRKAWPFHPVDDGSQP